MRNFMRNFAIGVALILAAALMLAKDKKKQPEHHWMKFEIQTVSVYGDTCSIYAKSEEGVTYYASGYAYACPPYMRSGITQTGYVQLASHGWISTGVDELHLNSGVFSISRESR
jgi:hypothetical protein